MLVQKCLHCNKERHPKSKPGLCQTCSITHKRSLSSIKHIKQLTELGYKIHTPDLDMWDNHAKIDITNLSCNHRFIANMGNVINGASKCGICGPQLRQQKMLAGYMKKYAKSYDITQWDDYVKFTRQLSDKAWLKAGNLSDTRGHNTFHLDHKVPIYYGFKNSIPPEVIADIINLELLPYKENLKKGCNQINYETLKILHEKYKFEDKNISIHRGKVNNDNEQKLLNLIRLTPTLISSSGVVFGDLTVRVLTFDKEQSAGTLLKESKTPKTLIIFEDELLDRRRRIIESRINHELGLSTKIFARKCKVVEMPAINAIRFFESNHLGGRINSSVRLGLEYEGKIVASMLFCKSRFLKKFEWELLRFANALDTTVVGGASKLYSYFIATRKPKSICTYTGKVLGEAGVYEKIGMQLLKTTMPNTWWVKNGKRINSQDTRQDRMLKLLGENFDETLGIETNMRNSGWKKIEDLGSNVYKWHHDEKSLNASMER